MSAIRKLGGANRKYFESFESLSYLLGRILISRIIGEIRRDVRPVLLKKSSYSASEVAQWAFDHSTREERCGGLRDVISRGFNGLRVGDLGFIVTMVELG